MKYVYVLTSSGNDYYYEQFLISITSLRLHNPKAIIVVLIDSRTKLGLTGKRSGFEKIVSEAVTINVPAEFSQKETSRWIKTSVKNYIAGDFLFIDCDTVITSELISNFQPEVNIGAALDTHAPLERHHLSQYFIEQDKKLEFTSYKTGKRFNSGIIFCRDTPESENLFSRWHKLWLYSSKKGSHHDMPALNQVNQEMGGIISELDGQWNCQITQNGLPFLYNAKIIHYYATAFEFTNCPFLPASNRILAEVKETGKISSELNDLLKSPKSAFESDSRIICGEAELDTVNSKLFSILLRFRRKKPNMFKKLNSFILGTRAKTQKRS